jgi:nucleoside 2-deoxyribosyltransferase
MSILRIYLAGGAFEVNYREYSKREFGRMFKLIDPMEQDGVKLDLVNKKIITDKTPEEIVTCDKDAIESCDVFVAYIDKYSVGTSMEILHSYNKHIPVYLIVTPGRGFENDIWLQVHSTKIFYSIDDCFMYIHKQLTD